MKKLLNTRVPAKQEGATAIEYGLIAGLIAVLIVGALLVIGPDLGTIFGNVQDSVEQAK
jgi:pilus assembly protein Flp/PilA